ncbi:hypothetical protein HPB47_004627, partial [Ixodes persulcatus]
MIKRLTKTIKWDQFRAFIEEHIEDINPAKISAFLTKATKSATDFRQDRRTAAPTKFRRHKRRCYLKRVTLLTKKASTYAQTLNLTRWIAHCESFDRTTKLGEVWRTFNAMNGKRKWCSPVPLLTLFSTDTEEDILDQLGSAFFLQPDDLPSSDVYRPVYADIVDMENPGNQPFTEWELDAAIAQCKLKSAPGPDEVTAPMLRNAPCAAKEGILHWINFIWQTSHLPEDWKMSW